MGSKSARFVPSSRLEQYDVVNKKGDDMGQMQNFVMDMREGLIAFALVSFGGFLGISDKWFAIPWELLEWRTLEKKFLLDLPREKLAKAPGIDKHKWPQEINLDWLKDLYVYFDCCPYWY